MISLLFKKKKKLVFLRKISYAIISIAFDVYKLYRLISPTHRMCERPLSANCAARRLTANLSAVALIYLF